jgi:hypothetical protein
VLTFGVQFGGARFHPGPASMVGPVVLVLVGALAGAIILAVVTLAASRWRRTVGSWRTRRRLRKQAATAEVRARALMSELCPFGWRAQITMFETGDEAESPPQLVHGRPARVALDWTEFRDETGRPTVIRRVWAATIGEALEAMVADRRTDETLEQIEQGAVADGAHWPDP